jgi:hypothetical protein
VAAGFNSRQAGIIGWQSDLVEEQMCEPEVVSLLHEYESPLRRLFLHFAMLHLPSVSKDAWEINARIQAEHAQRAYEEREQPALDNEPADSELEMELAQSDDERSSEIKAEQRTMLSTCPYEPSGKSSKQKREGHSNTGGKNKSKKVSIYVHPQEALRKDVEKLQESDSDGWSDPEDEVMQPSFSMRRTDTMHASSRQVRRQRIRMTREQFEFMCRALGIFPGFVQMHSMQQHVDLSLSRRSLSKLTYAAFVECLCRIAFTYLDIHGNDIQKGASSQMKTMWLLTMLRVKCKDQSENLNLSNDLGGPRDGITGGLLWEKRKFVSIDTMRLESLILWRTLDAVVESSRFKKLENARLSNKQQSIIRALKQGK